MHNMNSMHSPIRGKEVCRVEPDIEVGPWGGPGGPNTWTFKPEGRIKEIHLKCGGCVDAIKFVSTDNRGFEEQSERYGGTGGWDEKIVFADDEELIGISGTYGDFWGLEVIKSLSFMTNKRTTPQFGSNNGTTFSLVITKGKMVGLKGNYGDFLDSLGVLLHHT